MMNKIINWTFGSFFRTIGRFIFYILLALLISYLIDIKNIKIPNLWTVLDVYADEYQVYTGYPNETDEYIANINNQFYSSLGLTAFNRAISYNCSSSSSCTGSITNQDLTSGGLVWYGSMANYGFDVAHDTFSILSTNHLYSYSYVFCVPSGISDFDNRLFINSGLSSSRASQQTLLTTDWYALDNITWYNYDRSGANNVATNKCYSTYNLFNYSGSNAYTIKFNLHTSSFTNRYIGVLGYKLTDLGATNGLTSNQVQNIINNSGLATANSITDVQSSINDVQEQLDDVNSSIQDQIDADAQNTQDIIDNQNQNSQNQIDSQKVCNSIDKNRNVNTGYRLNINGEEEIFNNAYGITDYINITGATIKVLIGRNATSAYFCFYNVNKTKISCDTLSTLQVGQILSIPNNAVYFRSSLNIQDNQPQYEICQNGNQAMQDAITNDDSSGATNDASSFFNNFSTNTHGLTGIITAPLNAINSLTNSSCEPLVLPLPFVNENLTLPCMRPIYDEHFGSFMTIYDVITLGIISYWVMVRIFSLVKDFKNPEHDEVEVLDL